jgi:hypothetical protein
VRRCGPLRGARAGERTSIQRDGGCSGAPGCLHGRRAAYDQKKWSGPRGPPQSNRSVSVAARDQPNGMSSLRSRIESRNAKAI